LLSFDNLDVFFDPANGMAEYAIYTNPNGVEREIGVIFDSALTPIPMGDVDIINDKPSVLCKSVDVSEANKKAKIDLRAEVLSQRREQITDRSGRVITLARWARYNVLEVQPDSTGATRLMLTKD
jgi:hypothetical protein